MSHPFSKSTVREAQAKLTKARARAVKKAPYFADPLYALIPWPADLPPGIGTAVTKSGTLLFHPERIIEWALEDVVTSYFHESEHIGCGHFERCRSDYDTERWNAAGDAEINDDLAAMGCKMLPTDIMPRHFGLPGGRSAEEYYRSKNDVTPPRRCGSGAGNALPNEEQYGAPPLTKERAVQLEQVQEAFEKAVQEAVAKGIGNVPRSLVRKLAEHAKRKRPEVSWEQKLALLARRAVAWKRGHSSTSYALTNRRQGGIGYGEGKPILAAPVSPQANVALVQDTSGSMTGADLAFALAEAEHILRAAGGRVTFVACDAVVHSIGKVTSVSQLTGRMRGGGGTDFRPVFEALKRVRDRPDVIVFSTDGYGVFPEHAPSWCRVIWLLNSSWGMPAKAPWGYQVVVTPKSRQIAQGY